MKRAAAIAAAALLIGASSAPESLVTFRLHRTGCLLLKPNHPLRLRVALARVADTRPALLDRVTSLWQTVSLRLKPGYYEASVSTPRCWPSEQRFVVGSHWDREKLLEPGITLKPLRKDIDEFVDVYRGASAGLVIHTSPLVSKVTASTEGYPEQLLAKRSGDVWYFDHANVGDAKVTLFAGNRVAKVFALRLSPMGFIERFYRTP